jgi:hypothetical protein
MLANAPTGSSAAVASATRTHQLGCSTRRYTSKCAPSSDRHCNREIDLVPMCISNLAKLDIERNLIRTGQPSTMHIVTGALETRTHDPLHRVLPEESTMLIEHYLQRFRPHLASSLSTTLFGGRHGLPKAIS